MAVRCYRSTKEATDEIIRELNVRARCFPRWVNERKLSDTEAQDRLDRMATALIILEAVLEAPPTANLAELLVEIKHRQHEFQPAAPETAAP